jgi:hypothetical protein
MAQWGQALIFDLGADTHSDVRTERVSQAMKRRSARCGHTGCVGRGHANIWRDVLTARTATISRAML